jgi:hypothetical protein
MGNSLFETGERTWNIVLEAPGQNEESLRKIMDAKAHFDALGLNFPEGFMTPLFAEGAASREGMQIVITLSRIRDAAAGTMTVSSDIRFIEANGSPGISMRAHTEYGPKPETVEAIMDHLRTIAVTEDIPQADEVKLPETPPPIEREI